MKPNLRGLRWPSTHPAMRRLVTAEIPHDESGVHGLVAYPLRACPNGIRAMPYFATCLNS